MFTTEIVEYSMLIHRVLRDEDPPEDIDAICFFGQTHENDLVVLKAIAERWKRHPCQILVGICDRIEKGNFLVRGSTAWIKDLEKLGVKPLDIRAYLMSEKFPPSTDAEAYGMVEVIRENSWKRLVVTVNPLHAMRAFISLVSACQRSGLKDVRIWSAPSASLPWDETVCHSGGEAHTTRQRHIALDYDKMTRYRLKGDHLATGEVLDYFTRRNRL